MQSKTAAQKAKVILKSAAMGADIVVGGGGKEWRSGSPRFLGGPASVQTVANGKPRFRQAMRCETVQSEPIAHAIEVEDG
jgi:hypothetical protein